MKLASRRTSTAKFQDILQIGMYIQLMQAWQNGAQSSVHSKQKEWRNDT